MKRPKEDRFTWYDLIIYAARNSIGARRLATALGSRRWRDDLPERYTRRRPYFRGNSSPMVINWGSTVHPGWLEDPRFRLSPIIVNPANAVHAAIDKREFFQSVSRLNGIPLLKWTTDRAKALEWIGKGKAAIARTKLTGSSGEGIVLGDTPERLAEAPLYTRYYPKTHEFRVHVFNGKVIDLTQKKLKGETNASDIRLIRSHDNGWIHAHGDLSLSTEFRETLGASCVHLVQGMGLIFGAVDVMAILEGDNQTAGTRPLKSFVICEVNTGPGLENTITIEAYKNAILEVKNNPKLLLGSEKAAND
jgi:hypothetical protein